MVILKSIIVKFLLNLSYFVLNVLSIIVINYAQLITIKLKGPVPFIINQKATAAKTKFF